MKKLFFLFIPLSCLILYSVIALYSLSESSIEEIIICSTHDDTHYIPSKVCEVYLFNFRSEEDDIKSLESGSGLTFLFGIEDNEKKYIYLDHFIFKGLSINSPSNVDGLGLPPLHAAILFNDLELVQYLLNMGANTGQVEMSNGLTALEFLQKLNAAHNRLDLDRTPISKLLVASSQSQ